MNRRALLGTVGAMVSMGTLTYTTRDPVETLEIGVWLSEAAARYARVEERIVEYLECVCGFDYWSLSVSVRGVVRVSTEDGALVTSSGEWPTMVFDGALGRGSIDPAADVNLLVTDGQMHQTPTGYALPHIGSVGGARYLATLEPYDELVGADPPVSVEDATVPISTPVRTMQVLIHEVGHTLGLAHDHGVASVQDGVVVATPMISTYAFDPDYEVDCSRCGGPYPDTHNRPRKLSLAFSTCARRDLRQYSGGLRLRTDRR